MSTCSIAVGSTSHETTAYSLHMIVTQSAIHDVKILNGRCPTSGYFHLQLFLAQCVQICTCLLLPIDGVICVNSHNI